MKPKVQVRCRLCGEFIESDSRHDFRRCGCGRSFRDGGGDYLRLGGEAEVVRGVDDNRPVSAPAETTYPFSGNPQGT